MKMTAGLVMPELGLEQEGTMTILTRVVTKQGLEEIMETST